LHGPAKDFALGDEFIPVLSAHASLPLLSRSSCHNESAVAFLAIPAVSELRIDNILLYDIQLVKKNNVLNSIVLSRYCLILLRSSQVSIFWSDTLT
jgi:hypothetical protein